MRDQSLKETLFRNLTHASDMIEVWVTDCNTARNTRPSATSHTQVSPHT
jgi:hypothetical protein